MITVDSIEHAEQFAQAALAVMAGHRIPPTPNNYLVWYSHCSGCYPELSRRVLALESRGEGFSDDILAELHDRFFGTGRQLRLLNETCQRIETTMAELLRRLLPVALPGGMDQSTVSVGRRVALPSSLA